MNSEELNRLISKTIQDVAFEYLKEKTQLERARSTNEYLNSKTITDDDVDHTLFNGGGAPREDDKSKARISIRENKDSNLKITVSEIKSFENSFSEILDNIPGASIVFDKQNNGYSISATKRPDGVEAKSSGIINMGDNGKIIWSYSILNGFNVNAQNLKLSQDNKTMFEALTNHYDDWQKQWREKLNLPSSTSNDEQPGMDNTMPAQGGAAMAAPGQEMPAPSPADSSAPLANI